MKLLKTLVHCLITSASATLVLAIYDAIGDYNIPQYVYCVMNIIICVVISEKDEE